jgi:hypothetical protein
MMTRKRLRNKTSINQLIMRDLQTSDKDCSPSAALTRVERVRQGMRKKCA